MIVRSRRSFLFVAGSVGLAASGLCAYASAEFPDRPVKLVVPYAPGGIVDIIGRALAVRLAEVWRQPVVVENRAGAAEILAASHVAKSRPDGYTLLLGSNSAVLTNALLYKKLPYKPATELSPIARLMEGPGLVVVRNDSPIASIQDLIRRGKEAPEQISYGSNGPGSLIHLTLNMFGSKAGARFNHIPYGGALPALQAVLAGVVDFTVAPVPLAEPFLVDGRLRALSVTGSARMRRFADVPSLGELGYAEVDMPFVVSLVAPGNTPQHILDRIASDARSVVRDPAFNEQYVSRFGYLPIADTPEEFRAYLRTELPRQRSLVEAASVSLD